ncbi:hypothetical protein AX14_013914 [Amanita brunnescens Koide BX004]|nr:hypothetical protein AX14_013914 [Amanita brunnescens Koide BX004]
MVRPVAKWDFGSCQLDPGAVCGGLASACAGALTSPDANVIWQIVACTCAGLWCRTQAILNLLCCLGKIQGCSNNKFVGDKSIDVSQNVIDSIATFADSFGTDLLHASQGSGGGSIEGHPDLENIINEIMQSLTGDPNGMASKDQVDQYLQSTDFAAGWGH